MKLDNSVLKTIELILSNNDIELVDVEYEFKKKQRIIRFLIYKPDGIRHSDCENVTKIIEPILDVKEEFQSRYILEVASPGLDRPLKTESDFIRMAGKLAKILRNDNKTIIGRIEECKDGIVRLLKEEDNQIIEIPIAQMIKAKIEIEF